MRHMKARKKLKRPSAKSKTKPAPKRKASAKPRAAAKASGAKRKKPASLTKQKSKPTRASSAKKGVKSQVGEILKWISAVAGVGTAAAVIGMALWSGKAQERAPASAMGHQAMSQTATAPGTSQNTWDALMRGVEHADQGSTSDRMAFWSALLIGSNEARTQLARIADAPSIEDSAPLVPERFNCTTYVETVAALSRSKAPGEFFKNLLGIRYRDGRATYVSRNHFPEADWIPNNVAAGILKDVTAEIGASAQVTAMVVEKEIQKANWLKAEVKKGKVARSIASVAEGDAGGHWNQPVKATLSVLPLNRAAAYMPKIPNGTIMNVVRQNRASQPVLITHQGLVIQKEGQTYFRHANPGGQMRQELLSDYVKALAGRGYHRWPVMGLNFNQVLGDR